MQSGYGVPEISQQQFVADDFCFSVQKQTHLHHSHHLQYPHQQQQQQQQQGLLQQLQPISITQPLFQHTHQFQQQQQWRLQQRQQQQLRLEQEPGCNGGGSLFPFFPVNFKLGLNENSGNYREAVLNEDEEDALLRGSEQHVPQCWQPQGVGDAAIKEPFWKPLNTELFNRKNNRCNEVEEVELEGNKNKYCKSPEQLVLDDDRGKNLENKYRLFGELEAICSRAEIGETVSGSALTGEELPLNGGPPMLLSNPHCLNGVGAGVPTAAATGADHGSEASIGEEASLKKIQRRKRKVKDEFGSMAGFFERLVKQLMDHQAGLHRKFMEVIERMDQERIEREAAWRRLEAAKFNEEAIARAREQALASSREATIVSYLEKITGQSNALPSRTLSHSEPEIRKEPCSELKPMIVNDNGGNTKTNNRWPKAEVEALIQVRSGLEWRFQELGPKGPLWEEISSTMASMGYQRSAKRCKEKWENINKYFRKIKDSANKRPEQSKKCPYFDQLDRLCSSLINGSFSSSSKPSIGVQRKGDSELLDAIVAGNDLGSAPNPSINENSKVSEMVSEKIEHQEKSEGKEKKNNGDNEDDYNAEEEEEEEDEEGDSDDDGDAAE